MNIESEVRTVSLRTKLVASFLSLAGITLLVGTVGTFNARSASASMHEVGVVRLPSVESLLRLRADAERIRGSLRTFAVAGLPADVRARQYENVATCLKSVEDAWSIYEPLPQTPEEAQVWRAFVPLWNDWTAKNEAALALAREFDRVGISNPTEAARAFEQFTKDHHVLVQKLASRIYARAGDFAGGEDHTACNLGRWLPSFTTTNPELARKIQALASPHANFHATVAEMKRLSSEGKLEEAREAYATKLLPAADAVIGEFGGILEEIEKSRALEQRLLSDLLGPVTDAQRAAIAPLEKLVAINIEVADTEMQEAEHRAIIGQTLALMAMVGGFILASALGFFVARSITRPVKAAVASLSAGADNTASSATQVSAASQSLAEGASEQAASLEETSSSLEELSSMTKRNAENAARANTLARDARAAAESGVREMGAMSEAMKAISTSGTEISKIIKTIDEIAFQTNILALNAAVEAARAGDAGMGFAVVAEEVRSLAQRSAVAARETGEKIEGSIQNTSRGVAINTAVASALSEIVNKVREVDDLVAEVANASGEQSRGIEQVNIAISQMDKVTQSTAANAEESASASEELNAQADMLRGTVATLQALVDGSSAKTVVAPAAPNLIATHARKSAPAGTVRNRLRNAEPVPSDLF